VMLPLAGYASNYWQNLNNNGRLIVQRSLQWGTGARNSGAVPVAHWKLDETSGPIALDSEGGHNGTLTDGPVWASGLIDGALDFDGVDDKIVVPHDNALSLTDALTFTAWINSDSFVKDSEKYQTILSKGSANYWFGVSGEELSLYYAIGGTWYSFKTKDPKLTNNTWHHVAASLDSVTDRIRLYHNGVEIFNAVMTQLPVTNTDDWSIGSYGDNSEAWSGLLDDVRIYDTALFAGDINDIFNAGAGGGSAPDPVPGGCDGTYLDQFNAQTLNGSNGSINWNNAWQEVGENDNPTKDDIQVKKDISNYQLQIKDKNKGIQREVDLSGAGSATLSFSYRRKDLDKSDDYVSVLVSANGIAGPWIKFDDIGTDNDAAYQSYTRDISGFISANTVIRLLGSPKLGDKDIIWFDNIQIQCGP